MPRPLIISVEGNIGAGKTTIIDKLEKEMLENKEIVFLREPVDIWEKIKDKETGENILVKFYGDVPKYAFTFQVMAYASRLHIIRNAIKEHSNCKMIICERSLEADKNIFASMLHNDGGIEDIQYQVYEQFYSEYMDDLHLDGVVYIDAEASKCYERVKKRSRNGETTITEEYLQKCKEYHDNWLNNTDLEKLQIDANEDVSYENDKGNEWLNTIKEHINEMILQHDKKKTD